MVDAVVYLVPEEGSPVIPPSESAIDQFNLEFLPHLQVVSPGTVIEFRNSDPILHNVFSPPRGRPGFDLGTYPRDSSRTHRFQDLGAYPIMCHVHPEMIAYVVVVPTDFHAVVDDGGEFVIDGVPLGRYTAYVWNRRGALMAEPVVVAENGLSITLQPS
jgi:hypothetical protein